MINKRNAKFYCPVDKCNGMYFSQEELDKHSKLHGTFKCKFCSVVKTWAFDLAIHELEHGNKNGNIFNCNRCSYSRKHRNQYLVHHLKKHLKVTLDKIKCPDCEKCFDDLGEIYVDRSDLKTAICAHHIKLHNKSNGVEEFTEMYKKSNGEAQLSETIVLLLGITPADIRLKEFKLQICNLEECKSGPISSDDLEYHKNMHGDFKCSTCEFNCKFAPTLITHELEHVSDQSDFSCPKCTDRKMDKMDYQKHFLEHHLDKRFKFRDAKCFVCSMPFSEKSLVPLTHFVNEHDVSRLNDPEKVEKCNEESCFAYFLTRKQLIDHSQFVHNKTKRYLNSGSKYRKLVECVHTCDFCPLRFPEASALNLHKVKVHLERSNESCTAGDVIIADDGMTVEDFVLKRKAKFICPEDNCEEKFFTEKERDTHVELHGNFSCNFCHIVKTFAPDLALHELNHSELDKSSFSGISFHCSRCEFSSKRQTVYLSHHLEKHLNVSPDKLRCHICQMIFRIQTKTGSKCSLQYSNVLSHFVIHHDTSKLEDKTAVFNCAHCPAYFLTTNQLHLHNIRIHPELETLVCVDCKQRWKNRKELLRHRLYAHHNNDDSGYQFLCEDTNCQQRFQYKVDLEWHSNNHPSPNACPECGKIILNKLQLVRHVQSHPKYVCEKCGKKFPTKKFLAKHMSHFCTERKLVCQVCSMECSSKHKLEAHMKTHLKVKQESVADTSSTEEVCIGNEEERSQQIIEKRNLQKNSIQNQTNLTVQQGVNHSQTIHNKTRKANTGKLTNGNKFSCDFCSLKFSCRTLLLYHNRVTHPIHSKTPKSIKITIKINDMINRRNAKFCCPVEKCNGKYFSQEELDTHSKLHGTFKCKFCSVVKTWAFDLAIHELEHGTGNGTFNCKHCSFICLQQNNYLLHHLEKHLKVSPDKIKCPDCEKDFYDLGEAYMDRKNLGGAIRHHQIKFHNKSKSVDELTEMYKKSNGQVELSEANVKSLKINGTDIWLKEAEEFPLVVCNLEGCEPGLFSPDDLNYHKQMHGQFKCFSCEFNCKFAPTLITHELEHVSDQSDFSCPKCTDLKMNKMDYKKHFLEHHLREKVKFRDTKCPLCSMSFTEDQVPFAHFVNEHDLNRLNDPEKVERCNEESCSAYFLTRKQLIDHFQIVHNKTKRFLNTNTKCRTLVECLDTCDVCQKKFSGVFDLDLHKRKAHRQRTNESNSLRDVIIGNDGMTVDDFVTKRHAKFNCPEKHCEEKYFTEEERNSHAKLHGTFQCNFCTIVKKFGPDLAFHELDHAGKNNPNVPSFRTFYNCSRCTFSSKMKNAYISHHLEKHLNLSPDKIKCHICQMVFRNKTCHNVLSHYLAYHDTSQLPDKKAVFSCADCPAYFLTVHQLHLHNIRIHWSETSLNLTCVDCNKKFRKRIDVLDHRLRVHHNADESGYAFVCKLTNCRRRFEYQDDFDRHTSLHSTRMYSPNACPECGKIILGKGAFRAHVKSHIGNVCEQCGKKFSNKDKLTRHMLSHSGPESWEFVCEVCSKKCLTKGKLKEHMRIHTKVKPYICEKCGATYAHRHNWRHHMINKHRVKDFTRKVTKTGNITSRKGIKRKRSTAPDST